MRNPRMALSDPNHTPDPRPTGDLEHLFRQKFAEAEVTPRASLWEQLDHELLVQQNDTYRRRLLGYRWAAAASLLLLAGGGTWLTLQPNTTDVASASVPTTNSLQNSSAATSATDAPADRTYQADSYRLQSGLAEAAANSFRQQTEMPVASDVTGYALAHNSTVAPPTAAARAATRPNGYLADATGAEQRFRGYTSRQPGAATLGSLLMQEAGYTVPTGTTVWPSVGSTESLMMGYSGFAGNSANGFGRPAVATSAPAATVLLAATLPKAQAVPAALSEEEQPVPARRRRWKLSAGYAASAFTPNIDYSRASRAGATSSNSVSFSSADVQEQAYEMAASEYRSTLQSGLGQQVASTLR